MTKLGRLRLVRQRKALTQQQLAQKAGVNRVTISRLEGGTDEPFPTTVRKLADALGVEPEELTGLEERIRLARDRAPRIDRVAVSDRPRVNRILSAAPELATVVKDSATQLFTFIPDARLRLEVLTDPDHGTSEALFLGVSTGLEDGEAVVALRRFDEEWWVHNVRRAGGLLCIDLSE